MIHVLMYEDALSFFYEDVYINVLDNQPVEMTVKGRCLLLVYEASFS